MKKVFSSILVVLFVSVSMIVFAQAQSGADQTAGQSAGGDQSSTTSTVAQNQALGAGGTSGSSTTSSTEGAMGSGAGSTTSTEGAMGSGGASGSTTTSTSGGQGALGAGGTSGSSTTSTAGSEAAGSGGTAMQAQGQQAGTNLFISNDLIRLASAIGQDVMSAQGQAAGKINDIVLTADGKVDFILLSMQGGGASAQAGNYLVPFADLTLQNQQIALNKTDTSNLQPQSSYSQVVPRDAVRLSQLLSYNMTGGQNAQEKVVDVVANIQDGTIQYVVFSPSGSLGAGGNLLAVPYQYVWYNLTDKTVRIQGPQTAVQTFTTDNWPTQISAASNLGSGGTSGAAGTSGSTTTSSTGTEGSMGSGAGSTTSSTEGTMGSGGTSGSTTSSTEGTMGSGAGSTTSSTEGSMGSGAGSTSSTEGTMGSGAGSTTSSTEGTMGSGAGSTTSSTEGSMGSGGTSGSSTTSSTSAGGTSGATTTSSY